MKCRAAVLDGVGRDWEIRDVTLDPPRGRSPMYQAGALKLDELVTRHYPLEAINEAFVDLREGRNIRGIIDFADL